MVRYGTSGDGSKNEAGLPNVEGFYKYVMMGSLAGSNGSMYAVQDFGMNAGVTTGNIIGSNELHFDASLSAPIYGNSETVMPKSVNLPVAIYLG